MILCSKLVSSYLKQSMSLADIIKEFAIDNNSFWRKYGFVEPAFDTEYYDEGINEVERTIKNIDSLSKEELNALAKNLKEKAVKDAYDYLNDRKTACKKIENFVKKIKEWNPEYEALQLLKISILEEFEDALADNNLDYPNSLIEELKKQLLKKWYEILKEEIRKLENGI